MRLKYILFLLLTIFISFSVMAVNPHTLIDSTAQSGGGIIIRYITVPELISADALGFHFHVFNSSGYILTNTTADCNIHIYNNSNTQILKQNAVFDGGVFEINLGSNITNRVGTYNYIFTCNSTNEAGFVGHYFNIVDMETTETVSGEVLSVMILLPFIFGLMLLIGSFALDPAEHPVLRTFMMLLSFMTYFISTWIGIQTIIKYYNFPDLQDSTTTAVFIFGVVMFIILSYFMIYSFYKAVHISAQKKKEMMLND